MANSECVLFENVHGIERPGLTEYSQTIE